LPLHTALQTSCEHGSTAHTALQGKWAIAESIGCHVQQLAALLVADVAPQPDAQPSIGRQHACSASSAIAHHCSTYCAVLWHGAAQSAVGIGGHHLQHVCLEG
jgi:hypothetical protein